MRTLIVAFLFTQALLAQRGGFGHGGFGGGFRGGFRGGGARVSPAPVFNGGFNRGHVGGGFRVGVPGGHFGTWQHPGFRSYRVYGTYPWYSSPFIGFGWPGYYGSGYYGSPYWNDFGSYGTAGYAYPYASGPSVSVITVPGSYDAGPIVVTNQRSTSGESGSPVQARRQTATDQELRSPIYMIAAENGTIWAAKSYSVDGGKLSFVTVRDEQKSMPLTEVDRALTRELNGQAGLVVRLP